MKYQFKSKSLIEIQLKRKTSQEIVETIISAKKKKNWLNVAGIISGPRKNFADVNLSKISKEAKAGEVIVVPGKVLSQGEIDKKIKVAALGFSESAKEKLIKAGCGVLSILEEIKLNPEAKGVKILR
jgi:large subunit ribosomal protein L18e